MASQQQAYLFEACSALFRDLKGQELDFHQDQGSCAKLVICLPGRDDRPLRVNDIVLEEFGMGELEQRVAKVRKKDRVVEGTDQDVCDSRKR